MGHYKVGEKVKVLVGKPYDSPEELIQLVKEGKGLDEWMVGTVVSVSSLWPALKRNRYTIRLPSGEKQRVFSRSMKKFCERGFVYSVQEGRCKRRRK